MKRDKIRIMATRNNSIGFVSWPIPSGYAVELLHDEVCLSGVMVRVSREQIHGYLTLEVQAIAPPHMPNMRGQKVDFWIPIDLRELE